MKEPRPLSIILLEKDLMRRVEQHTMKTSQLIVIKAESRLGLTRGKDLLLCQQSDTVYLDEVLQVPLIDRVDFIRGLSFSLAFFILFATLHPSSMKLLSLLLPFLTPSLPRN